MTNLVKKPKRLLCIVGSMNAGGAETFLMKVYRTLDKKKHQMDFYVSSQDEGFYDKEILLMGGKIYRSLPKTKNPLKSFRALQKTVRNEKYDSVMRLSQHSLSALDLIAARLGGAKTLIYRSSNSRTCGGILNKMLHNIFKWLSIVVPTIKIAPSTEAAEFMFGKNCVKDGKVNIVNNAIKLEEFVFNSEKRKRIRDEFKMGDNFIIGHVGRFNIQKNHSFLVDVFQEIVKKHSNSLLVLVGKGELESEIKKKIETLGLTDKVIFTGVRSDVSDIMMAMDVFIFPSYFEGMPNTVVEAQATGLPCIISDTITKEANITDIVSYYSLQVSAKKWADKALIYSQGNKREDMNTKYKNNGYDITSESKRLMEIIYSNK